MAFRTVSDVLEILQARGHWQTPPLQVLLLCWDEIVGSTTIALNTRPVSVHRDVLRVATKSAAWAQTLTFSRKTLLIKVNQKLSKPLTDIHFSTAGWNSTTPIIKPKRPSYQEHPCYQEQVLDPIKEDMPVNGSNAVNETFDSWVKKIQASSQNLPLCPACQSPTPVGELERWGVCALCAAKRF